MKHELIIFDMDGTILDTLQDIMISTNVALKKNGYPEKTYDETKWLVGRGIPKLIRDAVPETASDTECQKVYQDMIDHYSEHSADHTKAYDGIPETIKMLKEKGYKLAVNTNKPDAAAAPLAEQYFPGLFDFVLGSRDELEKKPSPDGVNFICKHFSIDISKAAYIGDSDVDLQTGLNARIDFIGCDWGFRGKDFLLEHGAKKIAMKPSEILPLLEED